MSTRSSLVYVKNNEATIKERYFCNQLHTQRNYTLKLDDQSSVKEKVVLVVMCVIILLMFQSVIIYYYIKVRIYTFKFILSLLLQEYAIVNEEDFNNTLVSQLIE